MTMAYAVMAMLGISAILAGGARADECEPAKPDEALAAARAAGQMVLSGAAAQAFLRRIGGQHVPIRKADYIFLGGDNGAATMGWIDDKAAPIALRCDWRAAPDSPLAAIIAEAIARPPR